MILYNQYNDRPTNQALANQPIRDAPEGTILDLEGLPIKGKRTAQVVLVEFSDYECPFCARHAKDVAPELEREFLDTGKIALVFVNNPLPIHPAAKLLATAAFCAGKQDHYWEMHTTLFTVAPKSKDELLVLAKDLSLNVGEFEHCLGDSVASAERIESDMRRARELQFTGTPSFAVGHTNTDGRLTVEKLIVGAQPMTVFQAAINDVLKNASERPQLQTN
jgi:protein-disulfide isomerase